MRKIASLIVLIILLVISDGAVCYSIPPHPPLITSPVSGDILSADDAHIITWTAPEPPYWWVDSYKLLYTLDNGISWTTIHDWIDDEGNPSKFRWKDIPVVNMPTRARIKLLLLDLFDQETYSALSEYFTIDKPKKPVARFEGPSLFFKDKVVTFDASKSVDLYGSIVKYTFNFGDGGPLVEQTTPIFTHTYASYGNFRILLTVVDNRGLSDSTSKEITVGLVRGKTPLNISKSTDYSDRPVMDIGPAGDINIIWTETEMMFSRSIDGGKTFTLPKAIVPYAGGYQADEMHMVAGNNGLLHVVWMERATMLNEIFYMRSTDGGNTFSPPIEMSALDGIISWSPSIAADGTSVGIVWEDTDAWFYLSIQFRHSTDGGRSFAAPVSVAPYIPAGNPSIAMSSENIYIVSASGSSYTLYFSSSVDGGRTFSTRPIYDTLAKGYISGRPLIRLDSKDNIYLIWDVRTATSNKILLAKSTNHGLSFSFPKTIVPNGKLTDIVIDNYDRVFCTWVSPNWLQSYVSLSSDGGKTFSAGLKLAPPGILPQLSLGRQNRLGLIWGRTTAGGGLNDIFYQGGLFQPAW